MLSNQQQLDNIIIRVEEIKSVVTEIYNLNKNGFDGNRILSKSFKDLFYILEETQNKLKYPTLSLAMVGTTSAGKSTIVNALSGRNVAPMEKKETSAGVLRLLHNEKRSINVSKTEGAKWESGIISDITDDEIKTKITQIYDKYKRFIKTAAAPEITVYGPLQWQTNKKLLNLPDNLAVEFIDLPGLKTLTDEKNLSVIQKALAKSLCIIAMDFNDVDDTRIQRLLEELKDIVKAMSGKTDSFLFVLNKVDDVRCTDVPVDTVINGGEHDGVHVTGLKDIIKTGLSLSNDTNIEIIPFIGLLLYDIEQSLIRNNNGQIVNYNSEVLKHVFKDCSNAFEINDDLLTDEEVDLIYSIKRKLSKNNEIPLKDIILFKDLCYRISHANEFYNNLRNLICNSFSNIIIRPIVLKLTNYLNKFAADLISYLKINKKQTKLELYSERIGVLNMKFFLLGTDSEETYISIKSELKEILKELESLQFSKEDEIYFVYNRIRKDVNKFLNSIEKKPSGYINTQIKDIDKSISEITDNLVNLKGADNVNKYMNGIKNDNRSVNVFNGISNIPENIKKKLIAEVLAPFRKSIEQKMTKGEFINLASKTMPLVFAESLSGQYCNLFNLFYSKFKDFQNLDKKWYLKSDKKLPDLWVQDVKNTYHSVDVRIRDILSKKTNIYFQLETNTFITVLNKYLYDEMDLILKELKKKMKVDETDFSILIDNLIKVKNIEIIVPQTLFEFATPQGIVAKVGNDIHPEFDRYEHNSCSSDTPVYKIVNSKYYEYEYENSKALYLRWEEGIEKSFHPFWIIITDWIKGSVKLYMENIQSSALQVADMTISFLNEKMKKINSNNEENYNVFSEIEKKLSVLSSLIKNS